MSVSGSGRKLFGTDGVRGDAETLFTDDFCFALGRAADEVLGGERTRMVILRDTRESGERIERALAEGAAAAGAQVKLAGVLPTPAAPVLIEKFGFDVAAVVSASHNPFADNGIKFFGSDGMKLSDETEAEIERRIESGPADDGVDHHGSVDQLHGAEDDYLRALHERYNDLDLSGMKVVLDTANGATFSVAPEIMRRLGAEIEVMNDSPDGCNINADCGSTHLEGLLARVVEGAFDAGFAFDGDGDRMLAVDREGRVVDGDELIAIAALHLRERDRLPGDGVVVTVMTNYGFHKAMAEADVNVAVTPVGDRYVLEEMLKRDWSLGGEQSGHVIERSFAATGDGTASALLTLEAMAAQRVGLHDLKPMQKLPQTLVNVRVADRGAIDGADTVWRAVKEAQNKLEGRGRVLVRPSGTEPLVRVMVEAPTDAEARDICQNLADLIGRELG
jgi:phosphoglucosamine mutase